jgi:hypothetical protein
MAACVETGMNVTLSFGLAAQAEGMLAAHRTSAALESTEQAFLWAEKNGEHAYDCYTRCCRGDVFRELVELPSHRHSASETHTSRWRCKYDYPMTVQHGLDFSQRAWCRCRRFIVLQFPIPRSTLANADSLGQLPLG